MGGLLALGTDVLQKIYGGEANMSNRARFLKKALRCLDTKDATELHNLAIDLDVDSYYEELEEFTEEDNRILTELGTELTRNTGKRLATQRTRLGSTLSSSSADIVINHLKRLSPKGLKRAIAELKESLEGGHSRRQAETEQTDPADALESRSLGKVT